MANQIPLKAHYTGSDTTALGEFESGDTLDSALLDTGTGANQIVKLDGSAKLPAVDGSQLTNLPSSGGGGGGWTEIATQTLTASAASVTFASLDLSAYRIVRLEIYDLVKSNNLYTYLELSNDGFTTYESWKKNSLAWFDNQKTSYGLTSGGTLGGGLGQHFYLHDFNSKNLSKGTSGYVDLMVNQEQLMLNGMGIVYDDGPANCLWNGNCDCTTFTDLKLTAYAGNFTAGTLKLYGI